MNRLFVDILNSNKELTSVIKLLDEYANNNDIDIFLMTYPKTDSSVISKTNCFMVMSSGYKISLIKNTDNDLEFENYKEDIHEFISYLYQKYEYRQKLGRFKQWVEDLVTDSSIDDLHDLDNFWNNKKIIEQEKKRNSQLIISLCTGSINDISRLKLSLPKNLLEKVKQRIQLFDADQTRFIYQDVKKKVIKIQGLSGTGKTELLLHKLKALYINENKYKIFITCHNKILADSLKNRIPIFFNFMKVAQQIEWNKRLWCTHAWGSSGDIHSGFYRYICEFYQIPFRTYTNFYTFDRVCNEAIEKIKEIKDFKYAFDYVLVDECQDFKSSFIELCKKVTSKKVFLAGDIFQSIFFDFTNKDYEADYFLTKCYRTAPKTLMFSQALGLGLFENKRFRWLSKENWETCGYIYQEIEDSIELSRYPISRFDDTEEDSIKSVIIEKYQNNNPINVIIKILKQIKSQYPNVSPDDLCIIMLDNDEDIYNYANNIEKEIYKKFNWKINKAYETKTKIENRILISNRNNVKGLEYSFVICITKAIGASYEYRNAIYTMLSRSFLNSYLIISDNSNNGLSDGIINGLNEILRTQKMTVRKPSDSEVKDIETRFKKAQLTINKPFAEILSEIMSEIALPKQQSDKLIRIILNEFHWENYDEEILKEKIKKLSEID